MEARVAFGAQKRKILAVAVIVIELRYALQSYSSR